MEVSAERGPPPSSLRFLAVCWEVAPGLTLPSLHPYPPPQHFVCAKCEKPFLGHRHYEKKGLAYCETHYNQVGPGTGEAGAAGSRQGAGWEGGCVHGRRGHGAAPGAPPWVLRPGL